MLLLRRGRGRVVVEARVVLCASPARRRRVEHGGLSGLCLDAFMLACKINSIQHFLRINAQTKNRAIQDTT